MAHNLTSHVATERKMVCGLPWLQSSLAGHSQLLPQKFNPLMLFDKMLYSCNPRGIRKLEAVTTNKEIGLALILRTACSPGDMVTRRLD